MEMNIGWVGLGNMGHPMAKRLLSAGYALTVYNRTPEKARALVEAGAVFARNIPTLCQKSDVIFTMLSDDQVVKGIYLGESGLLNNGAKGKLFINMSTVSPKTSKELEEMSKAVGAEFLEAPVSGSVKPAEEGTLIILAGGNEMAFQKTKPYFEVLGKSSLLLGPVGVGSSAKLAINYFLAVTVQALAETVLFAKKQGVQVEDMLMIINGGACGSAITKLKTPGIISGDFPAAFALKHMAKDVRLAREQGIDYPLSAPLAKVYQAALNKGLGEEDVMAIFKYLEDH